MEVILNKNANYDFENLDLDLFEVVGIDKEISERIITKSYGYWKSVFIKVFKNPVFIISLIAILVVIVCSATIALGEYAIPTYPDGEINAAPSSEHWFGIGKMGEDLWNKTWIATRTTLIFTLVIVLIEVILGIVIGSIWGYNTRFDIWFIETIRFISIVPQLILWLFIIFLFAGNKGLWVAVLAVSITNWIGLASLIRFQILLNKSREFNIASKVLGSNGEKIIRKNILPSILPIVIQSIAFSIPAAIGIDASLAFLGFGFVSASDAKSASLGSLLTDLLSGSDWQVAPHLLIVPVGFIGGLALAFYVAGKIFADSLDPKNHR
ncbi:oligopeptide transport system permease protein [Spiroplasma chinense]|uniref:Oligopeptide transport system permease protein n=1 Tax=Spiroplasma chinense TaxID=216932 RepID=A0A5B9Y3A9_9MOLU|nr:oligopeptide ABC transporter permease OppC [Spiroplasma chinense]QEH61504.1 oligopeptide transport system permease protein [Spiroplasma chinense]